MSCSVLLNIFSSDVLAPPSDTLLAISLKVIVQTRKTYAPM